MFCPKDRGKLNPESLREISLDEPQLFIDDYLVENRFDSKALSANVPHVLHKAERPDAPLIVRDKPWELAGGIGHAGIVYDGGAQLFRLYYTAHQKERGVPGRPPGGYFMCYAESTDGITWTKPNLGLHSYDEIEQTNILLHGEREAKIANVHLSQRGGEDRVKNLGMIPPKFLKGHPFVMYYCDGAHYLATSKDGIHWEERSSKVIANRIDCYHTIVHDEKRGEFVSFLRNKLIFSGKQPEDYYGNTRMISRASSPDLWSEWDTMPTSVLIPDRGDSKRFYGMPTLRYAGVYLGFLQRLDENPQTIEIELAFSRDGIEWKRLPGHPRLIAIGEEGTWDGGMVSTGDRLLEVGDEWWLYYAGYSGYHDVSGRGSAIGLLRFRKEGFVSLRAYDSESYVLTKPIGWPGGDLFINAKTDGGYVRVRVTDQRRNTIPGFDYSSCSPFEGDSVRHLVQWDRAEMGALSGRVVRLEFKFRKADIFAFVATDNEGSGG